MRLISVIIPTCQELQRLLPLLSSLADQTLSAQMEVIVVANGGIEPIPMACFSFPVSVVYEPTKNVNRARNIGLWKSTGDLVFFFDDDVLLADDRLLEKHCFFHQENPRLLVLGGSYEIHPRRKNNLWGHLYHKNYLTWTRLAPVQPWRLGGGHLSIKKNLLRSLTMFDESIDFGGSETEALARLAQQGFQLRWNTSLKVYHCLEMNFMSFIFKALKQGRHFNRILFHLEPGNEDPKTSRNSLYDWLFTVGQNTKGKISPSFTIYSFLIAEWLFSTGWRYGKKIFYNDTLRFIRVIMARHWHLQKLKIEAKDHLRN